VIPLAYYSRFARLFSLVPFLAACNLLFGALTAVLETALGIVTLAIVGE